MRSIRFRWLPAFVCLLLVGGPGSAPAAGPSADPDSAWLNGQALRELHGPDLRGKDGPLYRLGRDLVLTLLQYEARTGTPGRPFKPLHPLVRTHEDRVVIDAIASGDPVLLRNELVALGLRQPAVFGHVVSGYLPLTALREAAALTSLQQARPAYAAVRSGAVTSQGDLAMQAPAARSSFGVDGTGILVGTLSDSYDCRGGAAADVASNDLPAGVIVLQELTACGSGIDEGRAMMQIVHDVAPGASQAFHSAFNGVADFASGILDLAAAGAQVINDDVIYYAEPMFQDGPIAQAVDAVKAAGVAYFSSAGNDARQSYEADFIDSGVPGEYAPATRHDFDPGPGVDTLLQITVGFNSQAVIVLQWQDRYASASGAPGAATDVDLLVYRTGGSVLTASADNNLTGDPVEIVAISNPGPAKTYNIGIEYFDGPLPGRIKLVYFGNMTVDQFATHSGTAYGHANAAGAQAVGAAYYLETPAYGQSPPLLESFSSAGGTPIYFDSAGNPVSIVRQKPEIVAPDGGDTTFFYSDYDGNGWPNFFGTSAAAPHAAGVAALLREFDNALTADGLYAALQDSAIDMGVAGVDFDSGHGLIQADAALATLDADGDGVPDSSDLCPGTVGGEPVDSDGCSAAQLDADGDGVLDAADLCPDTGSGETVDADGCSDFQKDTDGDGLSDGLEIQIGTNPNADEDFDGDGLSDAFEVSYNSDPADYDPATDLDPLSADTDLDGIPDGIELDAGYDPLLDTSYPVWGDINDDRTVDAADVVLAVQAATGSITLTTAQLARGNVAPLVGGMPQPPLADPFNAADLVLIQLKASGAVSFQGP